MKPRWIILTVLVVIAALVVGGIYFAISSNRNAVEKYKNQLRAQGEKLNWTDLAPIAPAAESNGVWQFMNVAPTLTSYNYGPPVMKTVAPGAVMVGWREASPRSAPHRGGWTNTWEQLAHDLEIKRPGLLAMRDVLDAPVIFFQLDYSRGFSILLPHLSRLRGAEMVMAHAAIAALHDGNYPEAFTNLQMSIALVQRYEAEPIIISHLVKTSMAQSAIGATWEALQTDHWTDAQLADLQSRWQEIDLFGPAEAAFAMEGALESDAFEEMRKSFANVQGIAGGMPGNSSGISETYPGWLAWRNSWSYDEELYHLQMTHATLEMFRKVKSAGAFAPALNELQDKAANIRQLHSRAQRRFILATDAFEIRAFQSGSRPATAEVARRMLVAAIALKRFQLRHGNYPPGLNGLSPELLSQPPIDLMDGQPLRYRLQPQGTFLLYSVGEDGVDNGGDSTPDPTPGKSADEWSIQWLNARDIVWPRAATEAEVDTFYTNSAGK